MDVFESIMKGLQEAVDYENGKPTAVILEPKEPKSEESPKENA